MHEALEDFEKKVIEAFKYVDVCYVGKGKKRRRRETGDMADYEDRVKGKGEDDILNVDEEDDQEKSTKEPIIDLGKRLEDAGKAGDAEKFKIVKFHRILNKSYLFHRISSQRSRRHPRRQKNGPMITSAVKWHSRRSFPPTVNNKQTN